MPLPGTVKLIDPGAVPADYPISTGTPIFGEFGSQIPSARTPREPLHRSVRHIALIVALGCACHPQGPRENNKAEHPMLPAVTA